MNLIVLRLIAILILLSGIALGGESSAVKELEKTRFFAFGGIGFAGATSDGEIAFHTILNSDSAEADFLRLLNTGNPQAKCYALLGLRLKNRPVFNDQARPFTTSRQEVQTCSGCIIMKPHMSSVLARIQRGDYDKTASSKK